MDANLATPPRVTHDPSQVPSAGTASPAISGLTFLWNFSPSVGSLASRWGPEFTIRIFFVGNTADKQNNGKRPSVDNHGVH